MRAQCGTWWVGAGASSVQCRARGHCGMEGWLLAVVGGATRVVSTVLRGALAGRPSVALGDNLGAACLTVDGE